MARSREHDPNPNQQRAIPMTHRSKRRSSLGWRCGAARMRWLCDGVLIHRTGQRCTSSWAQVAGGCRRRSRSRRRGSEKMNGVYFCPNGLELVFRKACHRHRSSSSCPRLCALICPLVSHPSQRPSFARIHRAPSRDPSSNHILVLHVHSCEPPAQHRPTLVSLFAGTGEKVPTMAFNSSGPTLGI